MSFIRRHKRFWLLLLIMAPVLAIGAVAAFLTLPGSSPLQTVTGRAAIGGPFRLVDDHGRAVTNRDFRGRLMLVYFGYTYCPDICPTTLQTLSQAMAALGPAADQVAFLFISVDPRRDTVAHMHDYVTGFDPHLVGLTGSEDEVAAAARAYRVYYQRHDEDGGDDYLVDHSSFVYLMDRSGTYLTHFGHDATPQAIAATIRDHLPSS